MAVFPLTDHVVWLKVNIPPLVQALWCESCLGTSLRSSSFAHGFKVQSWVQTIIDIVSQEYFIEKPWPGNHEGVQECWLQNIYILREIKREGWMSAPLLAGVGFHGCGLTTRHVRLGREPTLWVMFLWLHGSALPVPPPWCFTAAPSLVIVRGTISSKIICCPSQGSVPLPAHECSLRTTHPLAWRFDTFPVGMVGIQWPVFIFSTYICFSCYFKWV